MDCFFLLCESGAQGSGGSCLRISKNPLPSSASQKGCLLRRAGFDPSFFTCVDFFFGGVISLQTICSLNPCCRSGLRPNSPVNRSMVGWSCFQQPPEERERSARKE